MIVQAPCRISLFGGGSDLPIFYEKHKGLCISMAINLYKKVILKDVMAEVTAGIDNSFTKVFTDEFEKDALQWRMIVEYSDIPTNSGLGGSASMGVALVAALSDLKDKKEIAEKAWDIEVNKVGLYGGKQDQYAASIGGFNAYEFQKDQPVYIFPIQEPTFWQKRILLFDTGLRRTNPKVQEQLKELSPEQEESLLKIQKIAMEAFHTVFAFKDTVRFKRLINEAWEEKKKSNSLVTNEKIDHIYDTAIKAGAQGGKLCGSGSGGFIWFFVELEDQDKVIAELEKIEGVKHWNYQIDWEGVKFAP